LTVSGDEPEAGETALVVIDLISLAPRHTTAIRESIEREVGIPAAAVMVATTHTHSGPETNERDQPSTEIRDYVKRLCELAVRCVADAAKSKVPARMLMDFGHEPTVGKNRRLPGGVMDPAVPTIRIENEVGRVIGVMCCYACHPVTLGPDNRLITADYPGAVVRALEAVYPESVALFVTGCAGQINTGHVAEASLSTCPSEVRSFREMTRLGRAIAGAAVQASEHAAGPGGKPRATAPSPGTHGQVHAATIRVAAPRRQQDEPDELRATATKWRRQATDLAKGPKATPTESERLLRWAAWADHMAATSPHPATLPLDVTSFRWGDIRLVGLPGEPFVEFGLEIRQRSSADVIVMGYTNGCPGYVPHRSAYPDGGYEVLHAHRAYGEPSAFAPEAGERLVEAALQGIEMLGPFQVDPK